MPPLPAAEQILETQQPSSRTESATQGNINLPGYQLKELLYSSEKNSIYRGQHLANGTAVVVKALNPSFIDATSIAQLRSQFTIMQAIAQQATPQDALGIPTPYALEDYSNSYALVMEDCGSMDLAQYRQQNSIQAEGLPLATVLAIAIQLASILQDLSRCRVIHKDIKPANILIHPLTGRIKLIDFSLASVLPHHSQTLANPNQLEGTLAYLSPEQTGRMNRGIDYRSDFYSLGVVLYELLTNQLPFQTPDTMELVHCHLAKTPTPPQAIDPTIPPVVSDLVLKLMAKNAEDRYQSARGLQHDLEQCLQQLQTTGQIESFNLAQCDRGDRFSIPEKLYGREGEVNHLLEAFERAAQGSTELLLLAGCSGIGKTAVVQEVHKPIVRQRGYFIRGKYDQFQRNIPFSAFVLALRDLMGQLLSESDAQLDQWRRSILAVVGEDGQVLIEVIPELEQVIGPQPAAVALTDQAAQSRFNRLFQQFIQLFTTAEHPLVLFLDDLQWADAASLALLQLLSNQTQAGYLLILGAYRDNEVHRGHPLMLTLEQIQTAQATAIQTLTLNPLAIAQVNQLLAETLGCPLEQVQPLAQVVYDKTQGNPFFTTQAIKVLQEEGGIYFAPQQGEWQWDLAIAQQSLLSEDVVAFMVQQLQKLPEQTQALLQLAACIGNRFDLQTLAIVFEQSEHRTSRALWQALEEGFVLPIGETYKFFQADEVQANDGVAASVMFRFLHDRVQQAAYTLMSEPQRQITHQKIGRLLQSNLSPQELEEKLFDVVGHLNLGRQLLLHSAQERQDLAELNLAAGQKAKASTAYGAADSFVQIGLELLGEEAWQNQYDLQLQLATAAVELAYLMADFERMDRMAAAVLSESRSILDQVRIYEVQIDALTTQGQILGAIALGETALAALGIDLPAELTPAQMEQRAAQLAQQLQAQPIERLLDHPPMDNPSMQAAMQLLAMLFPPFFLAQPSRLPLLCSEMVRLSLAYGQTPAATIGYAGYGMVMASFYGQMQQGYQLGRLAIDLEAKLKARQHRAMTLLLFSSFLQHCQEPLREVGCTAEAGFVAAMELGNFLYAGYTLNNQFLHRLFAGVPLQEWSTHLDSHCEFFIQVKQDSPLGYLRMLQQMIENLQNPDATALGNCPSWFHGPHYDDRLMVPKHEQDNELVAIADLYVYKVMLAYLFGHYDQALEYVDLINDRYLIPLASTCYRPMFHFYAGLTYLALYGNDRQQPERLAQAQAQLATIREWAAIAPINYGNKQTILEAELARVLGQRSEAIEYYDQAIAQAQEQQFLQEAALANELAAQFYLAWGKLSIAADYLQQAHSLYHRWGSPAKTTELERRYPQLLAPTMAAPRHPSSHYQPQAWLDLPAIIQATQALSQEIESDRLLAKLMQIAIANAGAESAALITQQENDWQVTARTHGTCSQPLNDCADLPHKLIYSVARNRETAVFDHLAKDPQFAGDRYIQQQQPKSALCMPIILQTKLLGVLYLENNLTLGAFTHDRVETLQLLMAQAAISMENAQLYHQVASYSQTLEAEVARKTEDLHLQTQVLADTLKDLQQTQVQLVQSEKMSALGQMVSGIAHEINNPISFIHGNIQYAEQHIQDLLAIVTAYQQEYPQASAILAEKLGDVDLDFLQQDLGNILRSMHSGSDRIRQIILSLRSFSRLDEAQMKTVDLNEGLESTLLILQRRLTGDGDQGPVHLTKTYAELPPTLCYAGEMNQVFLNLLTNALDALKEQGELGATDWTATLEICTEQLEDGWVQIAIADNGPGIPPELQSRIFDPFFTTKPVGSGAGLGLSVSYSIIKKHGGRLTCESSLGHGSTFVIAIPPQHES